MEELQISIKKPNNSEMALEIVNGTFLAPSQQIADEEPKENGEREKLNSPEMTEGLPLLSEVNLSIKKVN